TSGENRPIARYCRSIVSHGSYFARGRRQRRSAQHASRFQVESETADSTARPQCRALSRTTGSHRTLALAMRRSGGRNSAMHNLDATNCVHRIIEAQVERTPDACAVIFKNRRLTYAELNASANRLAHAL